MAKKLFVGGLSYETTEATLKETFSQAGTVESAAVITDKISGRSKGFGFVEMSSDEEEINFFALFTNDLFCSRQILDLRGRNRLFEGEILKVGPRLR